MALNSGKILMRRGQEVNFDPNKMMPGEWAVSLDSKYVRMCFSPGVCVRMATYDAFEADMVQIQRILAECQTVEEAVQRIYEEIKDVAVDVERIETAAASALESEENALNSANLAVQSAETAMQKAEEAEESANIASTKAEQATEGANTATQKASEAAENAGNVRNMSEASQSYAIGGTGTREGEDTDNAKYYNQQASDNADRAEEAAERASAVADVGVATTEKAGLVRPDGETIRVDLDGTIHADRGTTSYTDLDNKPKINDVVLEGNKTIDDLGGLTAESTVTFSQASERTNIEATDNVKGIFGKVKKWFADLKPHAFSNPTNNLLATVAGTPLDAVQGKVLNDLISGMQNLLPLMQVASYGDNDFNNHPVNKIVQVGKSSGLVNAPSDSFYGVSMIIKSYFAYMYQLAVSVSSNAKLHKLSIRFNDGSQWGEWDSFVKESELNNGLTSIKVYNNTDFQTVAGSVPINKKLTCRMLGSGNSAVTGLPANQLFIVEIYAISEATAIATAYAAESGNMYVNRKSSGNWQGWVKKTDTVS